MISQLIKRKAASKSLSKRGDRKNIFRIRRFKNDHGFYVYALENSAEGRKIFVPRFVFGKFRACVREILQEECSKIKVEPYERSVAFLDREYFYFKSSRMDLDNMIIQDLEERQGSSGYITVGRRSLSALDSLLYDEALAHPNDVLESIISYHKLFQFSFIKGSKSITSELSLRKDVMQRTINYRPNLAEKFPAEKKSSSDQKLCFPVKVVEGKGGASSGKSFTPKLGERFHKKDIHVDYSEIFGEKKVILGCSEEENKDKKLASKGSLLQFSIPVSTQEVKSYNDGRFSFELSTQKSGEFRGRFVGDRACNFYLGFEIVDSLFTVNKTLKSFQFPLYYMRVKIRESGRVVHLESKEDGRIFLNHLALAQLVEKFAKRAAGVDPIDTFFKNLLAQHISVDQLNDRITLTRHLPLNESVFDRTREILFGYADENGKGGILGDLKFNGVECDLHSVYLYRAPRLLAPLDQALEHDLDSIYNIAHHKMQRFYNSLLGRFLTPEIASAHSGASNSTGVAWVPGRMPKSTRRLFDKLEHHDLVLLEGPPGTGKTHTILNLLIHYVCNRKRVLIVSDQRGAIEALVEKIDDYLGSVSAEGQSGDLLLSAFKVIDEVDIGAQNLVDVVDKLAKSFKTKEMTNTSPRKNIEKNLTVIDGKIDALSTAIARKMHDHMSEDLDIETVELFKNENAADISSLKEFLRALLNDKSSVGAVVKNFINFRRELIEQNLHALYPFFNLPSVSAGHRRIEEDLKGLRDDRALLVTLVDRSVESKNDFIDIVGAYPRHELVRYLETVVDAHKVNPDGGLKRVAKKITVGFRTPLQKQAQRLLTMVDNQIRLLELFAEVSNGFWQLLRDLHECIRINDRPNQALALYYRVVNKAKNSTRDAQISIQGDLEAIDELYRQRDKLVYQRFVGCLFEITNNVTCARRGVATDSLTRILALVEDLKQFSSIAESGAVFEEFKSALYEAFPVWIARKQAVPFLLPCTEQSFDLVIIDEATQCRVDDAMSLLFRAKKLLVVGDDKQTVLQKNSSTDDYLFNDHELNEHLRSTQARGFKGGGSNIFALIKSIKQASVMLDEHYRCPAQIIEFSNHYVYEDKLKVMQWRLPEQPSSIVVDESEFLLDASKKATSGKFKSIETEMIDRFLDYVERTIREVEQETGNKINVETDVALCYFLMKNEPYVKHLKDMFLSKLRRGESLLDGAGAALQGKERDYIFYLWDVTRYNLGAFTQGDDEDKRKGELNVLMSRPKKKAFHFLHRGFEQLDHGRSNITHYLWRALLKQRQGEDLERTRIESQDGSLLLNLLKIGLDESKQRGIKEVHDRVKNECLDFHADITVGDAQKVVDLIAVEKNKQGPAIGLVDLAAFGGNLETGDDIIDYFFQLKRAIPKIDPVFLFPYELLDDHSEAHRSLMSKLAGGS